MHGCWLPAVDGARAGVRLAVWAEDSTLPSALPTRRGRRPKVQPHPYAVPAEVLADLLRPSAADLPADGVILTLPGRPSGPLPSPELIRDSVEAASGEPALGSWRVPALLLDPDDTYALLRAAATSELVRGSSLLHLSEVLAFVADLVGRGRVLPTCLADRPTAVWRPVLTGADAAWARVLAAAAPAPLLCAVDAGMADDTSPLGSWVAGFDELTDAAVRATLGATTLRQVAGATPVAQRWLSALTGRERDFAADPAELAAVAEQLGAWQADAVGGPVRACFRLTAPAADDTAEGDAPWVVRFALQASDDPGLVVDADEVWTSAQALPGLGRVVEHPQEIYLAELAKASRLYPAIVDALRTARPAALRLDTDGAHHFLSAAAPTLSTAGFGVQLPGWWSRPSSRLGLRVRASTPGQPGRVDVDSGVGFGAIADFRYELAVGETPLTSDELAELTAAKSPLVRLRGHWVQLDARQLRAGLRLTGTGGQLSVGDLLQIGLGLQTVEEELPVTGIEAEGWLGDLLSEHSEQWLAPVATPSSFVGELRPYQARGLSWLDFLGRLGLGGVLADDMGLGKTVQLLALLTADRELDQDHDHGRQPSLLICPMSLVGNWQREAAKFAPELVVHVHHGAERARGAAFTEAIAACDLMITTYSLAARDAAALRKISWRRVVVDEAQAIKNAATKQATAIRSIPAQTRIAVTGTPVENRLADLWSILEFANPGLLGSAKKFRERYALPIERHGDDEAADRLRRFTGPFVLRRLKTDRTIIADLPDKIEMDVLCNLTTEQAALYQAVVDDMLDKINNAEGIERRGLVLATMTKLKQVCNHPAHYLRDGSPLADRSGKLDRLDEIVEELLQAGERALLFTQYAEFGALLRGHLAGRFGREVLFLHGGVAKADRDAMVARFQADDQWAPALFVLSLKAGGTGLTLTAANHVIHVDRWWNPAVEDQATDRAFRIGQRRDVQVRKFVCAGTVEEKIAAMISTKRDLAAKIVGSGEQWLTELTTAELADLVRLESSAVVE